MDIHTVKNGSHIIYRRIGILAGSSVFLLFLLGGLVRATGSGMGCPDWPKCFGQLAPPFDAADLPSNYQEIFLQKRLKKLERFTKTLESFGMNEKADQIRRDPKMYAPEAFDPVKAWIEYINRIFGVLSGILALLMGVILLMYWKKLRSARLGFFIGFVFLLLNAWLGSVVVTTNLLPGIVSLHFLLAFICLFGFLKSIDSVSPLLGKFEGKHAELKFIWLLVWIVVILGTWSREQIEVLRSSNTLIGDEGILNIAAMDLSFVVHRYVPALMLLFFAYRWFENRLHIKITSIYRNLFLLVFLQIVLGAVQIVFVLPAWSQIAHVLLGSALLTYTYLIHLSYKRIS